MGACETTPTAHARPGNQHSDLSTLIPQEAVPRSRSSAAACRHQARSSSPAPEGARCGRSSLTPPARRRTPAAARKSDNYSPAQPGGPTPRSPGQFSTPLDSGGPHGCDNRTQHDTVRRNPAAWHAEGQGSNPLSSTLSSTACDVAGHRNDPEPSSGSGSFGNGPGCRLQLSGLGPGPGAACRTV
jgi:hypothetical protein